MRFRRNADEEIRRWERVAEDPVSQARVLAAKLRAARITELQVRLAAILGHPVALILFPDDAPRKFDSEGMIIRCAGAWQTGIEFQEMIADLPFTEMAVFQNTVIQKVLDELALIISRHYRMDNSIRANLRNVLAETTQLLQTIRESVQNDLLRIIISNQRYRVDDNEVACDACGKKTSYAIIDVHGGWPTVECAACAPEIIIRRILDIARERAASFLNASHRWGLVRDDESPIDPIAYHTTRIFSAAVDVTARPLEVVQAQIESDPGRAEQYRSDFSPHYFVFLETCRLYTTMGWDFNQLMVDIGQELLQLEL